MFYDAVPADKHAVSRHGLHYINKSNQCDANIPHIVIFLISGNSAGRQWKFGLKNILIRNGNSNQIYPLDRCC